MQTSQEQYCPCLRILAQLLALEKEKTQSYPYQVLVLLTQLWLEMQKHISSPFQPEESSVERRMRTFLRYIHQHYAEELALADLAGSANVSKSECLRCFKSSLQTTPYHYLMEYRLSKAAALLESTDIPVGEISVSVGFHQMSYFGKRFREKTGYSPYKLSSSIPKEFFYNIKLNFRNTNIQKTTVQIIRKSTLWFFLLINQSFQRLDSVRSETKFR